MLRPRPEPLSVEEFEVEQVLGSASRRIRLGLLLAPCLAGLWVITAGVARSMDAGTLDAARLMDRTRGRDVPFSLLFIAAYETFGTRGLHALFASLILICFLVAVSGRIKRHGVEAAYGAEALREVRQRRMDRTALQIVAAKPELSDAYQASLQRPRPIQRSGLTIRRLPGLALVLVFWAVVRFYPHASVLLTALLAWLALGG